MGRMKATILIAVCALLFACAADAPLEAPEQDPNVLFILTDDQNENTLDSMPNVKGRVQQEGTTFKDFYVSQSWCCPSRASSLTGEYPHNHGVTSLRPPDGGESVFRGNDGSTVATALDSAGYDTGLVGKYMNDYKGAYVPPGWDTWVAQQRLDRGWGLNRNGTLTGPIDRPSTAVYRDAAMGFLDRATDSPDDAPFFLWFATNAPHLPASEGPEPTSCYRNLEQPRTGAFDEADVSDKPGWIRAKTPFTAEGARTIKEAWCNQRASLKPVDAAIGEMLDLLEGRGELNNTYIVFTSDNGTSLGEHRYYIKRGAKRTAYEEGAGVPFIVRGPGVAQGTTDALATNNDLAPTVASWAGTGLSHTLDGRPLTPVLGGQTPDDWRTQLLNESHSVAEDGEHVPDYDALLTGETTYVEWETGERELYDLNSDPYQLSNLLYQATPEAEAKAAELSGRLETLKACSGDSCREAENSP